MAKVSFRLIGNNSLKGATELSGSYWNICIIGNTDLDLRKAVFPQDKPVRIKTLSLLGKSKILVPEGTKVDLGGFKVVGNYKVNVSRSEDETHNHLKVSHYCLFGDAKVRSK
ncbi:LiaF domain-containing protein [Chloroflexota bacterium]